jgi:hypothetical protein
VGRSTTEFVDPVSGAEVLVIVRREDTVGEVSCSREEGRERKKHSEEESN